MWWSSRAPPDLWRSLGPLLLCTPASSLSPRDTHPYTPTPTDTHENRWLSPGRPVLSPFATTSHSHPCAHTHSKGKSQTTFPVRLTLPGPHNSVEFSLLLRWTSERLAQEAGSRRNWGWVCGWRGTRGAFLQTHRSCHLEPAAEGKGHSVLLMPGPAWSQDAGPEGLSRWSPIRQREENKGGKGMQRASCGRDPGLAGPDRFATPARGVSEGPALFYS